MCSSSAPYSSVKHAAGRPDAAWAGAVPDGHRARSLHVWSPGRPMMHRRGLAETLRCCSDHLVWARRQTTPGGGGARHLRALRWVRAGGSHLRYRIGVPADRSDGEAGLGSRRGFHPRPLRLLRRQCTQVTDTLFDPWPSDPRMSSEVLRAYRQQRQLGWRVLRRPPIIGCSGYPSNLHAWTFGISGRARKTTGRYPTAPRVGGQMPDGWPW